jgi:uncharacterized protein (TIGR02246 family)
MKHFMASGTLVTVLSGVALAQSDGSVKDEVLAAQRHFSETRKTCNAQEMERLVRDDMMWFHSSGGKELNKADFVKYLSDNSQNPGLCGLDEFRVDVLMVRIYGDDTAVLVGDFHFKAKGRPEMTPPEKAMQVFVKQNGRWLLAANQTTKLTEPAPLATKPKF